MAYEKNLVVVNAPDVSAIAAEGAPLVERAKSLVINSRDSHGAALEGYAMLKQIAKKITAHYEPTRAALDKAKKELLKARDSMLAPIEEAAGIVSGKADAYEREERRKAEEARLQAEAAEKKRLEEEALEAASDAELAGDTSLADAIVSRPVEVVVDAPRPDIASVSGVSARVAYHAKVVDLPALVSHVAAHPLDGDLVMANLPALNARARAYKDKLSIPGVRSVPETVRSVRG